MHILVTLMRQHRKYLVDEFNSPVSGNPMNAYLSYQLGGVHALHTLSYIYPDLTQDDIIEMDSLLNECEFLRYRYRRI